jgi:DNA-binding MarR family transcriptional regulator
VEGDLVTRAASESDRRRILLRLTPLAEELLEDITRRNIEELTSNEPVFRDLLKTLRRLGADS